MCHSMRLTKPHEEGYCHKMCSSAEAQGQIIASLNVIYEECVCRDTPSIEIKTSSGLISHHDLGHYLL